jgi:hypothetical protein
VTDPRGGAHVSRRGLAGDVALLLDADHEHDVVAAGLDLGHRGEDRHAARCARGLVTARRRTPQRRTHGRRHRAEVRLPGEQLAERVADVDRLDR